MSATVKVTLTIHSVPADTEVDAVAWADQLFASVKDARIVVESIDADVLVRSGATRTRRQTVGR